MSSSERYTLEDLKRKIIHILATPAFPHDLYRSITGILAVLHAVSTKGDHWVQHVQDETGKSILLPEEQPAFAEAFQPYSRGIRSFFKGGSQGGAFTNEEMAEKAGFSMDQLTEKRANLAGPSIGGIDDLYGAFFHKIGKVNATVNGYASQYGILKLEKQGDLQEDVRMIPEFLQQLIASGVMTLSDGAISPERTKEVLDKFKMSYRSIIVMIYLFLDLMRMSSFVLESDQNRKLSSVVVSFYELLRGDWKKSILSFMGYYGTMPLFMGQIGKVYLTLFHMFSPSLQDNITYGVLDATKSFIIGMLLSIFQIAAPLEVRLSIGGVLEKIAERKRKIDGSLESQGLPARPGYFLPTFQDLNHLQSLMDDPAFVCSAEFQEMIKKMETSTIIRIILQLMRIPDSEHMIALRCKRGTDQSFVQGIVAEAKMSAESEEPSAEPSEELSAESQEAPANEAPANEASANEAPANEASANEALKKGGRRRLRIISASRPQR